MSSSSMSHTPMSMDAQLDSLAYLHFALLYIDENGKLRFEASPSIANNCHTILSPDVTDSFLRAVALSDKGGGGFSGANFEDHESTSPLSTGPPDTLGLNRKASMIQDADRRHSKRRRVSHECVVPMSITSYPKTKLPIRNQSLLRRYYEKAFESLQQTNCRILAKAYIKLVEPRKQVNFPYNGRKVVSGSSQQFDPEMTKPAWWPAGVTHREPDHLLKPERIRLLVHILCELRESHAICVEKLKEADQSIRRQISPAERLQVLDEIYRVREEEESYLDGKTDGTAVVCISRVHLPDMIDAETSFCPSTLMLKADTISSKEIPDLESHTSVFQCSGSSPTTDVSAPSKEITPEPGPPLSATPTTVPTTWNPGPPMTATNQHDTTLYPLDLSAASSLYPPPDPTATLDAPFAPRYYSDSHLPLPYRSHQSMLQGHGQGHGHGHSQPSTSIPVLGLVGTDMSGCTQPYYFGY